MKFIYFSDNNKHVQGMLRDLYEDERVIVIDGTPKKNKSFFLRALRKFHLSLKINLVITLPWRRIWLNGRLPVLNHGEEYVFLFIDYVPMTLDFAYLKKIRKDSNGKVKHVLFLLNPVTLFQRSTQFDLDKMTFDYILSYDFEDSQQYGFVYEMAPYSMAPYQPCPVEKDLYLICWNKGRLPLLHEIYQNLLEHDVSSIYRITGVEMENQKYDGIIYNQKIEYDEVIREFLRCNCIMDMVAPGHTGVSVRYYEAVCYNKKLLTNNKNIVSFPFYDPNYMHIYEKPEDIDWEWVKERTPVNYHYNGCFSPSQLLTNIEKLIHQEHTENRDQ